MVGGAATSAAFAITGIVVLIASKCKDCSDKQDQQKYVIFLLHNRVSKLKLF